MANWTSYDAAARCHDAVAGPKFFARPAADLVASVDVHDAGAILDVGTGSAVAALAARALAPADAQVTGIDPSIEMLRTARRLGLDRVAVASAPGLPFAGGAFDRVIANFVVNHMPSYNAGLADMARVLRAGGRLGMTAWGPSQYAPRELWDALADACVGKDRMAQATRQAIPWEDWLTDPDHVREALAGAGLVAVQVDRREYDVRMTRAEYLATREKSVSARFLRHALAPEEWGRFWQHAVSEFERRFPEEIAFTRDVWIGTGRKN